MSIINPSWLRDYYKGWTDDDLHARYSDISTFEPNNYEKFMLEMESKRREEAYAQRSN